MIYTDKNTRSIQCLIMNIVEILYKTEICTGQYYTFVHLKTTIDYALVCESFCDCILLCKVVSTNYTHTSSDHLPIYCKCHVPVGRCKTDSTELPRLLRWKTATIEIK